VKECIKSNKEKAERDRQNDGEVENKKWHLLNTQFMTL
jgi:hypothetical protein